MLFSTDDPDANGQKLAAMLQKELGRAEPVSHRVVGGESFRPAKDLPSSERLQQALGGSADVLYNLQFDFEEPRSWDLYVPVMRAWGFVVAARLFYAAWLDGTISGEVHLPEKGPAKAFQGHDHTAGLLNRDRALVKRLSRFARTRVQVGDRHLAMPRRVTLSPEPDRTRFVLATMTHQRWFGLRNQLEPQVFLQLASQVEHAV